MRRAAASFLPLAIMLTFAAAPALAQDGGVNASSTTPAAEEAPTGEQCTARYDLCSDTCASHYPDNESSRKGCVARCASDRAGCEAKAGFNQAKPWLERQYDKTRDFFRGFRGDPDAAPAEEPSSTSN